MEQDLPPCNYARLQRMSTDSWVTIKLPRPMAWETLESWVFEHFQTWDLQSACENSPDEIETSDVPRDDQ